MEPGASGRTMLGEAGAGEISVAGGVGKVVAGRTGAQAGWSTEQGDKKPYSTCHSVGTTGPLPPNKKSNTCQCHLRPAWGTCHLRFSTLEPSKKLAFSWARRRLSHCRKSLRSGFKNRLSCFMRTRRNHVARQWVINKRASSSHPGSSLSMSLSQTQSEEIPNPTVRVGSRRHQKTRLHSPRPASLPPRKVLRVPRGSAGWPKNHRHLRGRFGRGEREKKWRSWTSPWLRHEWSVICG